MANYWDKPCASAGLTSYRYKGQYGWIMIGAKNTQDALQEALRSITSCGANLAAHKANLQVWDFLEGKYTSVL